MPRRGGSNIVHYRYIRRRMRSKKWDGIRKSYMELRGIGEMSYEDLRYVIEYILNS